MLGKYTQEGLTLVVFGAAFVDYGLKIVDEHDESITYFYNPHYLSNDSYGRKPSEKYDEDWDEAEEAEANGDDKAFVPFTEDDWRERLEDEFDEFVETCLGMTPDDVQREWRERELPYVKKHHEADGIVDYPARSESFCNFVDRLNKDHRITDSLAANVQHPDENYRPGEKR